MRALSEKTVDTPRAARHRQGQSWLLPSAPNPRAGVRLFCFPYAGGAAHIYRSWQASLPSVVEVCPVQLPGHGQRILEPAFDHLTPLVEAAAEALLPYCDKPFAFFGHSMGALISFELSRLFRRKHDLKPIHLFVSGHRAPQLKDKLERIHDLPDDKFILKLRELEGTPAQVLEQPELMQLLMPILRADFGLCETYEYVEEPPLDSPITAFGGTEDETGEPQLEGWREQTSAEFSLQMFPGGHFFIHTAQRPLLHAVADRFVRTLGAAA
ncbi:MAG TPA: alpha/beta fold hydrolase [Pyrinomonadaceae bacterium]